MIEKRNKRYVKNGLSSSWERYTSNLEPNEDRIRFYLKVIEVDNLINPSLKLYKPEFNNLEHKHQVIDCLKRYEFKRGLLITLHVPSYLTFGRYSETSKLLNERNPEDYFYQIEQILQRFNRRLERRVFKVVKGNQNTKFKNTKNDIRRLEKFSVIEGCYFRGVRNHIHMVIEVPEGLTQDEFIHMIKQSHGSYFHSGNKTSYLREQMGTELVNKRGNPEKVKNYKRKWKTLGKKTFTHKQYKNKQEFELGKIHIKPLNFFRDYQSRLRLFTYLTKEVEKDRNTVSSRNTHFKKQYINLPPVGVFEDLESIYPEENKRKQKKESCRKSSHYGSKQKIGKKGINLENFYMDDRLMRRFNKSLRVNSEKLSSIKV